MSKGGNVDRKALAAFKKAYAGKPVTAERLHDLFVHYREQAEEALYTLTQTDLTRVKNPCRIQDHGVRSCRDAEVVLCVAFVFQLSTEGQYREGLSQLTALASAIFTALK
jgi:hypothetical protein